MKTRLTIIASALSLLLVSCIRTQAPGMVTIQHVRDILSDPSGTQMQILSSAGSAGRYGGVYVIGTEPSCNIITSALMELDAHDNASGAHVPDYLPDFAGETFWNVSDSSTVSLRKILDGRGTTGLRELSVDLVISALDTSLSLSRYDKEGMGYRSPAKFIILSDAVFAPCGESDIDTLFRVSRCDVPVLVPVSRAFRSIEASATVTRSLGVIAPAENIPLGIYSALYKSYCVRKGVDGGQCVAYSCSDSSGVLQSFLDKYLASGYSMPLDVVIVDDMTVDAAGLRREYESLSSVMNESYEVYGKLFAPGFRIVSSLDELVSECYSIFRKDNLFSHEIKFPQSEPCHYTIDNENSVRFFK